MRSALFSLPRSGLRHSHQASQLRFGAQHFTVSEKITRIIALKRQNLGKVSTWLERAYT